MMRSFTAYLCVKLGSTSDDTIYLADGWRSNVSDMESYIKSCPWHGNSFNLFILMFEIVFVLLLVLIISQARMYKINQALDKKYLLVGCYSNMINQTSRPHSDSCPVFRQSSTTTSRSAHLQ